MDYKTATGADSRNSLLNYFTALDDASRSLVSPLPSYIEAQVEQRESSSASEGEMFKSDTHAQVLEAAGDWGAHRFEEQPFATRKKEVKIRNYHDLKLEEEELNGVLSQRLIACCVSNLERVPELNCYAYCKLILEARGLTDITAIKKYHFIQYLDLSFNRLTTLQPLGDLPFLQYLHVHHNELENLLDFKAPFYLSHVNFSYNQVKKMVDLKDFWSLVYLDLSFNEIEKIEGIESLKFLSYLDLSDNQIQVIENISNLRLQTLMIRSNMIDRIEEGNGVGFPTLGYIRTINLTYNKIESLRYFEECYNLETLIVAANKISSLMDIYYLRKLTHLHSLDIRENPVCCMAHCFSLCYRTLQHLHELNGDEVTPKKRVMSKFSQDIEYTLRARLDRMELLLLEHLNLPVIGAHVVPCDFPPPPIILVVGTPGSRKKEVVFRFVVQNRKAVLGVSHTTRPQNVEEVEGRHYYFVEDSKFDDLLKHGEFMTMSESYGFRYAISFRELCKSTAENKVLVFYTDLSAALMLKLRGLCPKIVLALPMSETTHLNWLKETYIYHFINTNLVLIKNCPACVREATTFDSSAAGSSELSESSVNSNFIPQGISVYLVMGINPDLLGEKCVQCDILEKRSTGKIRRDISKAVAFHNSPESLTDLRHEHNHPLQGICHKSVSDSYLLQDKMSSKPTHPNHHPLLSVLSRAQVHTNAHLQQISLLVQKTSTNKDFGPNWLRLYFQIDETDTEKQETIYMTATETFETLQQEHLKIFLEDVMENRAQLLSLHNENTGLFKDVVFTDDIDYALLRLKTLLKYTVENHIASRTVFNIEEDPKFQKMIDHKLKKLALLQNIYSKNF